METNQPLPLKYQEQLHEIRNHMVIVQCSKDCCMLGIFCETIMMLARTFTVQHCVITFAFASANTTVLRTFMCGMSLCRKTYC